MQQQQTRKVERAHQHARRTVRCAPLALTRRIHTRTRCMIIGVLWVDLLMARGLWTAAGTDTGSTSTSTSNSRFFDAAAAAIKRVRAVHVSARHRVLRGDMRRRRL